MILKLAHTHLQDCKIDSLVKCQACEDEYQAKITAKQIIDFLKEHNHGDIVEQWNHGVLERVTQSLILDSMDWEELLKSCK